MILQQPAPTLPPRSVTAGQTQTHTEMSAQDSPTISDRLQKIVSGGQTGVDRAGLDAAIEHGLPIGGWCPRGRRAEDGRVPSCYPLTETPARSYAVRTRWNVRDSDGTLIVAMDEISAGTQLTVTCARRVGRPLQIVKLRPDSAQMRLTLENSRTEQIESVVEWIHRHRIRVLNIAGPRGSSHELVYAESRSFVSELLDQLPLVSAD